MPVYVMLDLSFFDKQKHGLGAQSRANSEHANMGIASSLSKSINADLHYRSNLAHVKLSAAHDSMVSI